MLIVIIIFFSHQSLPSVPGLMEHIHHVGCFHWAFFVFWFVLRFGILLVVIILCACACVFVWGGVVCVYVFLPFGFVLFCFVFLRQDFSV